MACGPFSTVQGFTTAQPQIQPPNAPSVNVSVGTGTVYATWSPEPGVSYIFEHTYATGDIAWAYPVNVNGQYGAQVNLGSVGSANVTGLYTGGAPFHFVILAENSAGTATSGVQAVWVP